MPNARSAPSECCVLGHNMDKTAIWNYMKWRLRRCQNATSICADNIVWISKWIHDIWWFQLEMNTHSHVFFCRCFSILSMISNLMLVCQRADFAILWHILSSQDRNEIAIAFEALSLQWNFFAANWRHTHTFIVLVVAFWLVRYLARNFSGKTSCISKRESKWLPKASFTSILWYVHVISILMNVPRKTCAELQTQFEKYESKEHAIHSVGTINWWLWLRNFAFDRHLTNLIVDIFFDVRFFSSHQKCYAYSVPYFHIAIWPLSIIGRVIVSHLTRKKTK